MVNILVIDDDADVLNSVSKMLSHMGYKVKVAHNGDEGVALLGNGQRFDCVITDINMPGMNGYDVAKYIRESGRPDIPVIAITGCSESDNVDELFAASLLKPFRLKTLIDLVVSLGLKAPGFDSRDECDSGTCEITQRKKGPVAANVGSL